MKAVLISTILLGFSLNSFAGNACKKGYHKIDCSTVKNATKSHFCSKRNKYSEKKIERICQRDKRKKKRVK